MLNKARLENPKDSENQSNQPGHHGFESLYVLYCTLLICCMYGGGQDVLASAWLHSLNFTYVAMPSSLEYS